MTLLLPFAAKLITHANLGPCLQLDTAAGRVVIAHHGATVISYVPTGQRDLLWLSPDASVSPGKAIRGGIPLCGPWFGPHELLATAATHGLMRTRTWDLVRVEKTAEDEICATFEVNLPAEPTKGWAHHVRASCKVTLHTALTVELSVTNTGLTPFMLSGALHTYFAVSDIHQVRVHGVGDREFIDFTHGRVRRRQPNGEFILTEEAANFFLTNAPVKLADPSLARTVLISSSGHGATVVWNPWDKTSATMGDVGANWPQFICIEPANIPETAVPLLPRMTFALSTRISLEP